MAPENGTTVPHGDAAAPPPLLTIGYGNARSSEEFVELLHRNGVRYLVDVRTSPYSKFRPEFSKDGLEAILRRAGLAYVFMGDSLGGMPADPGCYTDGTVDYDKCRRREPFIRAVERLESGWRGGQRIAIMCAELEPQRCHRSKLVGEALVARAVAVGHIDEDGAVITHAAAMDRLTGGQGSLFDLGYTSRKRYEPPNPDGEGP